MIGVVRAGELVQRASSKAAADDLLGASEGGSAVLVQVLGHRDGNDHPEQGIDGRMAVSEAYYLLC